MLLDPYYSQQDTNITVSAQQGSDFAKRECQDFNPIHDCDSSRFCVPGDLLFSLALKEYGASESMTFTFTNLVKDNAILTFPETSSDDIIIRNGQSKSVLEVAKSGISSKEPALIEALIKNYVLFSGQNFPKLLMPVLEDHQVMFNPEKPLIMYNTMNFKFETLTLTNTLHVELADTSIEIEKKRAKFYLHFDIFDGDAVIGRGVKTMIIAGLRPYDAEALSGCCERYLAKREAYNAVQ